MLFPTATFAIFFLIVLPLSWLAMPKVHRWRPFIIVASYVFYSWWDWRFIFLLAGCTLWNQLLAVRIHRASTQAQRKALLTVALIGDLGVLAYFKYYDFFISSSQNMAAIVGLELPLSLRTIILPVGISFYTFMAISYVVDTYRGDFVPTTLEKFAVYLSFFPHLVAGPIVRPGELIPQLDVPRDPRRVDTSRAFYLIATGLFKKVVIANYLASHIVDQVFGAPGQHSSLEILIGIYAYAVQIYADFSGYTDIAIGLALLLGFKFPQNFDSPYAAVSLQDFWRRWHMTLSRWLRDYLYIPLGGNRKGTIITYRNLMLTMLIGGLWHGAGLDVHRLGRHPRGRARDRALAQATAGLRRAGQHAPPPDHRARDHVQHRLPRVGVLPGRQLRDGLGHADRALHRLGPGLAARHRRRAARDRGRDRIPVPAGALPDPRDGSLRAAARARPGRCARVRPDAHEHHGPGGRGTLHLLPLLMSSSNPPELPKLPPIRESAEHVLPRRPATRRRRTIGPRPSSRRPRASRPRRRPRLGRRRDGAPRSRSRAAKRNGVTNHARRSRLRRIRRPREGVAAGGRRTDGATRPPGMG